MKDRLCRLAAFVTVLALVSLACQTVTGLLPGGEQEAKPEPTVAPLDEAEEPSGETTSEEVEATESETDEIQLGDVYTSTEGGFSFRTIPGYEVEEFMGLVNTRPEDDEEVALMLMGSLLDESIDLEDLYQQALQEVEEDSGDIEFANRRDVTVDDIPGIAVDVSGPFEGEDMVGRIVIVVVSPTQEFRMIGIAPADRWETELASLFETTLATVQFFEAEPSEMDFDEEVDEETEGEATEPQVEEIRQWAVSATASSEYSDPDWAATQATGEPDTMVTSCEDLETAWASSGSDTVEWLELGFDTPVVPTEINIIQTHSPDQVVQVEVIDTGGAYHTVYTGEPENLWELCPYTLSVPITDMDVAVDGIKITIDQSVIDTSWNEIDAVELVGLTETETVAAPADEDDVEETVLEGGTAAETAWRAGGERGTEEGQIGGVAGMDATADGLLYVTDETFGLRVHKASDGSLVKLIGTDDLWQPSDVQVGPDGNIYVADWGDNKVYVFTAEGDLINEFGEDGNGPGQFGSFTPDTLAISPEGEVYILDDNETDDEEDFLRVEVFSAQGDYLREFPVEEENFSGVAIELGPDGNLYVLGFVGHVILKYSPDGTPLGKVGEDALLYKAPQDLAIDDAGNFYVALWSPSSVVKLDPAGNLIGEYGVDVDEGDKPWPEGSFFSTAGVAVLPDGSRVFASDWSPFYAYITTFEFKK